MGNSKIIYRKNKKKNKEAVQQEKIELLEIEVRRKYVAGSKEYTVKITIKEVRLKTL